jgi:hypothetical protein
MNVNNYGIIPRQITRDMLQLFFDRYPNKNERIAIGFFTAAPDAEMLKVKGKIMRILKDEGYINVGESSDVIGIQGSIPPKIVFDPQQDGSVWIRIPPAQ